MKFIGKGITVKVVTHDSHLAAHEERALLIEDGKITKEKRGMHLVNKNLMCPCCRGSIQKNDVICPSCQKELLK